MSKVRNKAYRPRQVNPNAMDWALSGSYTLPASKQAELIGFVDQSFDRLRAGAADRDDWNCLVNGLNIAEAFVHYEIGTNLLPQIADGQAALRAIGLRMLGNKCSTCYATELAAVKEARDMYSIQLGLCSQAEAGRAVSRVNNLHRSGAMGEITKLYEGMAA